MTRAVLPMGVGVNGHTSLRQRLLTLLAGFFGFVMTAVFSAIPGSAVADVIRIGATETANAAGTGASAATVASLDRDRRSARVGAAVASTARAESRDTSVSACGTGVLPPAVPDGASSAAAVLHPGSSAVDGAGDGRRDAAASRAHDALHITSARTYDPGVVVLSADVQAGVGRRVAVIVARSTPPPTVSTSAVRTRGPPPSTGS
jgi:hypothetical protein